MKTDAERIKYAANPYQLWYDESQKSISQMDLKKQSEKEAKDRQNTAEKSEIVDKLALASLYRVQAKKAL